MNVVQIEQEARRQLASRIAEENSVRWVDHRDEYGEFPPAPTPAAMDDAIAVKFNRLKIEATTIDYWMNQCPVSEDADYICYP